jgi:ubiquinone/menaquinone biosynthesis C-methylase UbiE
LGNEPTGGSYVAPEPAGLSAEQHRLEQQASSLWQREQSLLTTAGLKAGDHLLDLGCGPGRVLKRLVTLKPALAIGIDVSHSFLQSAVQTAPAIRGDVAELPFATGSFDFIYTRLVLRHVREPGQAVRESHRVLRSGGVFASFEPDEVALELDPEPEGWPRLRQALTTTALRRQADPFVGRRLRRLYLQAGFTAVNSTVLPWTSQEFGPTAFMDMFLAPKARPVDPDLISPDEALAIWNNVAEWSRRSDAFGYGLSVFTTGRKR